MFTYSLWLNSYLTTVPSHALNNIQMKQLITLLLIVLGPIFLFGQNIPNANFNEVSMNPCPFDSTQQLFQYDDWFIYQTINDAWDGPIDSTKCIGLVDIVNNYQIDLSQIDAMKPLFIKSLMGEEDKILLESNYLYTAGLGVWSNNISSLNDSTSCANGFCSGALLGIEIPSEDGMETQLRIYPKTFTIDSGFDYRYTCIPTEKFNENYLKEVVFKFTFNTTDLSELSLRPASFYFGETWNISYIENDIEIETNEIDSIYNYYLDDMTWGVNTLILYGDTTYPSAENISYLEANFTPNQPDVLTFNMHVSYISSLVFQPFTDIRGSFIEGSDSIRHQVNLILEGGNLCIQTLVDMPFEGEEKFIYKDGNIDFGKNACMQFKLGAKLVVADNATLHYGEHGMGMIALRQGGTIELGKNSTLVIDNTLKMYEYRTQEPQQIYMTLNTGSSLIFGEYAHINNTNSLNQAMKLNVFMKGGVLDVIESIQQKI